MPELDAVEVAEGLCDGDGIADALSLGIEMDSDAIGVADGLSDPARFDVAHPANKPTTARESTTLRIIQLYVVH